MSNSGNSVVADIGKASKSISKVIDGAVDKAFKLKRDITRNGWDRIIKKGKRIGRSIGRDIGKSVKQIGNKFVKKGLGFLGLN